MYNLADKIRYQFKASLKHCDKSSIAYKYLSSLSKEDLNDGWYSSLGNQPMPKIDYQLLRKIVDEITKNKPSKEGFGIHLRLGDVFMNNFSTYDKTQICDIIAINKLYEKYSFVRLYYGNHNNRYHEESQGFIDRLSREIKKRFRLDVKLISNSADKDFCDLSNEQCLILTRGGFSMLAGSINPNMVIWDLFESNPKQLRYRRLWEQFLEGKEYQKKIKSI